MLKRRIMGIKTISPQDLYRRIKLGHNVVLLDVRSKRDYEEGHIMGASLHPLEFFNAANIIHKVCAPFPTLPTIYVVCASGSDSMKACQHLANAGYDYIINLEGGMRAWAMEGLPLKTIKEKLPCLPVREPVQVNQKMEIMIGSIMSVATLLGTFVNVGFLAIPFLVGVGFIYEGLFGTDYLKQTLLRPS